MIRDVIDINRYEHPDTWGVLCIDCWNVNGANNEFYNQALEKLSQFNVGAVVNCAVDLKIDYSDKSVYNTLTYYCWEPNKVNEQLNLKILSDLIKCAGHQTTSKVLNDNFFNEHTVHLSSREGFLHHAHCFYPTINNWIILGSAWKMCLHTGPLGIVKLVDMNTHKFHIFPSWSIQTELCQPVEIEELHKDWYVWAPIKDDGYRLICRTESANKWIFETT